MSGVTLPARAKLNLSLDVLGTRGDGFHDLRMVMQSCSLADEVYVETAGEGGPWGMALLAAYRVNGAGETLEDYLDRHIFAGSEAVRAEPIEADMAGFEKFLDSYKRLLPAERAAVEGLR